MLREQEAGARTEEVGDDVGENTNCHARRSGNPKGRPRGSKNLSTLVKDALKQKVVINENGRQRTATKGEVAAMQLVNRAVKGEPRALKMLLDRFDGTAESGDESATEARGLTDGDREILRHIQQRFGARDDETNSND